MQPANQTCPCRCNLQISPKDMATRTRCVRACVGAHMRACTFVCPCLNRAETVVTPTYVPASKDPHSRPHVLLTQAGVQVAQCIEGLLLGGLKGLAHQLPFTLRRDFWLEIKIPVGKSPLLKHKNCAMPGVVGLTQVLRTVKRSECCTRTFMHCVCVCACLCVHAGVCVLCACMCVCVCCVRACVCVLCACMCVCCVRACVCVVCVHVCVCCVHCVHACVCVLVLVHLDNISSQRNGRVAQRHTL